MHIEIPKDYTLRDLDQFIRDIWVECCGHLSEFVINNTKYPSEEYEDTVEDMYEELENRMYELASITDEELKELEDIYSSIKSEKIRKLIDELIKEIKVIKLIIKNKPAHKRIKKGSMDVKLKDVLKVGDKFTYVYDFGSPTEINLKVIDERKGVGFRILARNLPIEFKCAKCGKKAKWICPICFKTFCDECAEEHAKEEGYDADELFLPIVNSPRCGVCGYEGSEKYGDI